jgi:hypothetical protein
MGQPKRLEEVLSAVLHRRKERAERRSAHIAELRKRATEAEAKLKRLYDAIENGIADVSDPMLKERVTELKAIRDQSRADAERAEGALDRLGPSITPQALKTLYEVSLVKSFCSGQERFFLTRPELYAAFESLAAVVAPFCANVDVATETFSAALHGLTELERSGRIRPAARVERVRRVVRAFVGFRKTSKTSTDHGS